MKASDRNASGHENAGPRGIEEPGEESRAYSSARGGEEAGDHSEGAQRARVDANAAQRDEERRESSLPPGGEATGEAAADESGSGGERPKQGSGNDKKETRRIGPFGLGDAPAWLAVAVSLVGVIAALIFSGLQFDQSRKQSEQTEKALRSNTAATIYQEDREVWQRVTPDIYDYFHGTEVPKGTESDALKKARIVAGAMLDHFEHVRVQIRAGALDADRPSWDAYITETFKNSPLLCQEFRENALYYGGGGPGTIGDWANVAGCRP